MRADCRSEPAARNGGAGLRDPPAVAACLARGRLTRMILLLPTLSQPHLFGFSMAHQQSAPHLVASAAEPKSVQVPVVAEPKIDFLSPHVSPRCVELVTQVLESGWVSEGPMVERFERELASTLGVSRPVALNSGTSALHLALAVAGVGPGDEVILPPQTFIASGLSILMQRAVPVFADVDPRTGNILPASIARKITPRTKAVMPVHFAGYPCDMDEINELAARHGLTVIEDAAHALGATYRGRPVGSISRLTAFSFQATKHLTSGDGGMLCSLVEEDEDAARRRRWFGIDRRKDKPSLLGERVYRLAAVGYKYHMNDLAAAVGLGNLEGFPARLRRRQRVAARLRAGLRDVPGLELLEAAADRTHAYWLFPVLVLRREDFVRKLAERGIPASVVNRRIDRHPVFGGIRRELECQARFDERQISLPVHEDLTGAQVEYVVEVIRSGW